MKFKKGDKVKVIGTDVHPDVMGATGTIVDVDPDWYSPYELSYDSKELDSSREAGWLQDLFRDEDLELVLEVEANPNFEEEEKPKKVKDLPTASKLFFIRDLKGDGDTDGIRNASIIDLEKGVNRLNLRTNDVDDIIESIRVHKPSQVIFEIHDRKFKELLLSFVNGFNNGFKIADNGVVIYGGASHG